MKRLRLAGRIRRPKAEQIRTLAASEYMTLGEDETADVAALVDSILSQIERLDDMSVPEIEVKYPSRDKGCRPTAEENPYNAVHPESAR